MGGRLGIYLRGATSLAATIAVVVGLPAFLVVFVGWPLPRSVPSLAQVWDALDRRDVSTEVLVNTLAVIAWLAWAQFTAAVVVEAIGAVWGRAVACPPGYPGVQAAAGRLVASIVVAVTALGTARASGAAPLIPPAPVEASPVAPTPAGHPAPDSQPAAARPQPSEPEHTTYTTQRGDTFWGLAQEYLGDGLRWREIRDLNVGRAVAPGRVLGADDERLQPGWQLRLPARATTDAAEPGGRRGASLEPGERSPEPVTVQPGDNLWTIAEDQLADQLDHEPTDVETFAYWQVTVEQNIDSLASGDPDLIYPGEQVVPPAIPAATQPPPVPPDADTSTRSDDTPIPPPPTTATANPQAPTTPPPTTAPEATAPSSTVERAPTPTQPPTTEPRGPDGETANPGRNGSEGDDSPWSEAVDLVPLGVSVGLAGLTLRTLARRRRARRRSARPGTATPPRPAEDAETERALAAEAGDVLDRLAHTVRLLGDPFRSLPDPPTVTGIVVNLDGDVAVHLDGPAVAVEPFIEDPASPSTWRLPAAQAEPPADDGNDWVPVLETVVTIGRTADGAWVFIDLESLGAVSVDGDRDDASALVRSFVAELALQPAYHCVDLTIVGDIETPTITEQGVLTSERLDEPLARQLHRLADDTASYLDTERVSSTHAARARGLPRDGLVANLVAVGRGADPVLLHRLAEATMPGGRGLALVALDPLLDPAHQLVMRDHHVDVPHLGLTVEAARLTLDDLQTVDGLLTREPDTVTTAEGTLADTAPEPALVHEPDWQYVVRVFADLRVESRHGDVISFRYGDPGVPNKNTNRGPELIAYLALTRGRSATIDKIRDHLWWGRPVKRRTVENLISGTRRVLGGTDYLTRVERGSAHGTYTLTARVVTDIDLVQAALAEARATADDDPEAALSVLHSALASIDAPAFRTDQLGGGLAEWAAANRIVDRIEQPVIDAALLAADLATRRDADAIDTALAAIDAALRACPTNEALTRAAMRLEAEAGHPAAANTRYQALATQLLRDDLEPEPETTKLRSQLTSTGQRIG